MPTASVFSAMRRESSRGLALARDGDRLRRDRRRARCRRASRRGSRRRSVASRSTSIPLPLPTPCLHHVRQDVRLADRLDRSSSCSKVSHASNQACAPLAGSRRCHGRSPRCRSRAARRPRPRGRRARASPRRRRPPRPRNPAGSARPAVLAHAAPPPHRLPSRHRVLAVRVEVEALDLSVRTSISWKRSMLDRDAARRPTPCWIDVDEQWLSPTASTSRMSMVDIAPGLLPDRASSSRTARPW